MTTVGYGWTDLQSVILKHLQQAVPAGTHVGVDAPVTVKAPMVLFSQSGAPLSENGLWSYRVTVTVFAAKNAYTGLSKTVFNTMAQLWQTQTGDDRTKAIIETCTPATSATIQDYATQQNSKAVKAYQQSWTVLVRQPVN
jgi:hypothetical protein